MAEFFILIVQTLLLFSTQCDALNANYDENLAKKMLSMSAASYSTFPENCFKTDLLKEDDWKLSNSVDLTCDILSSTCAAFIAVSDHKKQIVFAFRGTKTKPQLLLEALGSIAPQKDFFGLGFVHQYFKDGLAEVWASVNSTLVAEKTKAYEIIFTGHSLGGALASLASALTVHLGFRTSDKVKLISFGQPRVGDSTFASNHDRLVPNSFRVVNKADIVPHVPKCTWESSFPLRLIKIGANVSPFEWVAFMKVLHEIDDVNHLTGNLPKKVCLSGPEYSYYHHGTEVWYPNGMGQNAKYVVCTGEPKNEDISCSDSLHDQNPGFGTSDHYPYFVQSVSHFGKGGCKDTAATSTANDEIRELRNVLINYLQGPLTGK